MCRSSANVALLTHFTARSASVPVFQAGQRGSKPLRATDGQVVECRHAALRRRCPPWREGSSPSLATFIPGSSKR
jgi:hypothetical protein